jgi:hypothetical protein
LPGGPGVFEGVDLVGARSRSTPSSVRAPTRTPRYGHVRPDRYPRPSPALVAQGIAQRFPKPSTIAAAFVDDLDIVGNHCRTGDVDGLRVRSTGGRMTIKPQVAAADGAASPLGDHHGGPATIYSDNLFARAGRPLLRRRSLPGACLSPRGSPEQRRAQARRGAQITRGSDRMFERCRRTDCVDGAGSERSMLKRRSRTGERRWRMTGTT